MVYESTIVRSQAKHKVDSPLAAALLVATATLSAVLLVAAPSPVVGDDTTQPVIGNNGYKIYLSPAYHTDVAGARGECQYPNGTARVERLMARYLANRAVDLKSERAVAGGGTEIVVENSGLKYRGFVTRQGNADFDVNASSSNSWGADAHLALHSNASTPGGCAATSQATPVAGSIVMYQAGGSDEFAKRVKYQLQDVSPGTNDKTCTPSQCSQFSTLAELGTSAPARAYSETEFHTWNVGIDFLNTDRDVAALRIARAIDNQF